MGHDRYRIILTGIKPDAKETELGKKLADLLDVPLDNIQAILSSIPVMIMNNTNLKAAMEYLDLINQLGGICKMETLPSGIDMENSKEILKTCPNCGYNAVSPNDPLISLYGKMGECPSCGTIPEKKRIRKDPGPQKEREKESPVNMFEDKANAAPSLKRPLIIICAVFFLLVLIHFSFRGPKTVEIDQTSAVSSMRADPAVNEGAQRPSSAVILPGQTRRGKMSVYLPFLHRDSYFPLNISANISAKNSWEEQGVIVNILNTSIKTETIILYERYNQSISEYVPDTGVRMVSYGSREGMVKGNNLFVSSIPDKIINDAKSRKDSDDKNEDRPKNEYTVYCLEVDISIIIPAGEEFSKRELTSTLEDGRTVPRHYRPGHYSLAVSYGIETDSNYEYMTGTSYRGHTSGWSPSSITSLSVTGNAALEMTHKNNQEGLYITASMSYPCRFAFMDD